MAGGLERVSIGTLPYGRLAHVVTSERFGAFTEAMRRSRKVLDGRVVWNLNSTARGGGVAEMLASILAYAHGAGVDARWDVIPGNADFFAVTKRLHNYLHASPGDHGPLGDDQRRIYESTLMPSLDELEAVVSKRDIVVVHDPQPAGLIPGLKDVLGVPVIWRCHIGADRPDDRTRMAWDFLRPYVEAADAFVFSRQAFVWEGLDASKVNVIAPVIDTFSPKNQVLDEQVISAILDATGIVNGGAPVVPVFTRMAGTQDRVTRQTDVRERVQLRPEDRLVVQVSRWDRLKDPLGVIEGFVEHVAPHSDAHLVCAGPSVAAVADDPEGCDVLNDAYQLFDSLPPSLAARVHIACLPMDDFEENAAIVNALQRRASVVVQKSIAEGFGLTVAEAMWKARPVVASRVGGIQDQITDGVDGILLVDPHDLPTYGAAVAGLLRDRERAGRLGRAAHEHVRDHFLVVRSLLQYFELIERLLR